MTNLIPTLRYLWLTLQHKWFVLLGGLRVGAPLWRLIIHDWSKFLPSEAPHYGRQFFGAANDPAGFATAWLHHQNRHPHHWEYWMPRTGHKRLGPRGDADMRYQLRLEPLAGATIGLSSFTARIVDAVTGRDVTPRAWIGRTVPADPRLWHPDAAQDQAVVTLSALVDRLNAQPRPQRMPEWAMREMVADWLGASRAYEGRWPTTDSWPWWEAQRDKINLHPATRLRVEQLIAAALAAPSLAVVRQEPVR